MAYIIADRVLETSTSTGTGAFALAAAITGFRRFSAVCAVNDTAPYYIEGVDVGGVPTGEWETGLGTYSGANTLTRSTVVASSNANSAVNFSAGTKRVGLGIPASRWVDSSRISAFGFSLIDDADAAAARTTLGLGTAATMAGPAGAIVGTTDTQSISAKTFSNCKDSVASAVTGTAITIDPTANHLQRLITTGNPTITWPSPVVGAQGGLEIEYGGAHIPSYVGGARKWEDGTPMEPTAVLGKKDFIFYTCFNATDGWILCPRQNY